MKTLTNSIMLFEMGQCVIISAIPSMTITTPNPTTIYAVMPPPGPAIAKDLAAVLEKTHSDRAAYHNQLSVRRSG